MSRNFELLQAAGKENLFFPAPSEHPRATAVPIADETISTQTAPDSRQEVRSEKSYVNELRPMNGYPTPSVRTGSATSPKWFGFLREGTRRLAMSVRSSKLNGGGHTPLDLKAMALQEEIKLVQRVFFSGDAPLNTAIVFSAVENGEASARICARAAESLASHVKTSVCVVDANLSCPSLHQYFGATNNLGLTEAVLQKGPIRRFAQQLAQSNLWFIPCGAVAENSWTRLNPDALRGRLQELRTQFGHVLISAPPMNVFADAALISQFSDGVVVVVEANSTRRKTTQRLIENLAAAKVQVRGVVLNNRTFPIPELVYRRL